MAPVVQTMYTDLHQHVKRDYAAADTAELVRQMRAGVSVPRCRPEQCIDMMAELMSNMSLHLVAVDGYLNTGMIAPLDDAAQDQFIVREVGALWKELGMRDKINAAVAEVRAEVVVGRLRWCAVGVSA